MLKLRGTSVTHALEYLRRTYGRDTVDEFLRGLPEPHRSTLLARVIASGWYHADVYTELLRTACERFNDGDPALAERISAYDMESSFAGPYRALFRFGPTNMIRLAALVWRHYYNEGRLVIERSGPGFVRARLVQFRAPDSILCRNELTAGFVRTIQLSGGRHVEGSHIRCVHDGAEACEYELTWE